VTYKRLGLISSGEANVSISSRSRQVKVSDSGFNVSCPSLIGELASIGDQVLVGNFVVNSSCDWFAKSVTPEDTQYMRPNPPKNGNWTTHLMD